MSRFSNKCEQYFRINFENKFNFQDFNLSMIRERVTECIVAFDPSYIKKSGKHTYGLGMYWSGCAGRAKRGLDICGFAIVDVIRNTAFHLNAIQTPKSKGLNLLQYYCQIIKENYLYFKELTTCLVADSYFAKSEVVQTVLSLGMHFMADYKTMCNNKMLVDRFIDVFAINPNTSINKQKILELYKYRVIVA